MNADPDELGTFDGDDFATGILKKRKFENKKVSSAYLDPKFLQPKSNLLERFLAQRAMPIMTTERTCFQ